MAYAHRSKPAFGMLYIFHSRLLFCQNATALCCTIPIKFRVESLDPRTPLQSGLPIIENIFVVALPEQHGSFRASDEHVKRLQVDDNAAYGAQQCGCLCF